MSGSSDTPRALGLAGTWFARGEARRKSGTLVIDGGAVRVEGGALFAVYALDAVRCAGLEEPLIVALPDGGSFVAAPGQEDAERIAELLARDARVVRRWERSWPAVILALAGAVGLAALLFFVILPAAARPTAFLVPEKWARLIDDQALLVLDDQVLGTSALTEAQQAEVARELRAMVTSLGLDPERYRVLVRSAEGVGPNAFALPGGTLVVTDDMVELASAPHELEAVMAHEVGHVEKRHGLQTVLRSSTFAVLLVLVGPDPSAIASLASGLPAVFLESGYSRDFEREADDYACRSMVRLGYGTQPFAEILRRLAEAHPAADGIPTWISSHPDTAERIETIEAWEGKPAPRAGRASPAPTT